MGINQRTSRPAWTHVSTSTVQFQIWTHFYEGFYLYIDDFIMDTGFESAELVMDHLDVSKEFYLSR